MSLSSLALRSTLSRSARIRTPAPALIPPSPTRAFHLPPRRYERTLLPDPEPDPALPPKRLTNRQIPYEHVFVLDTHTNRLSPTKQPLAALLAEQRGVVELITETPEPIVRVTTRAAVEARYRELRKARQKEDKEVRFAWGVASADVRHKLRKARRDIEKGYRVVVVVSFRRQSQSQSELVAFADEIKGELDGVAEEWQERKFSERSMTLSFRKAGQGDNNVS